MSSPKVEGVLTQHGWFDTGIGGSRVRVVPLGLACCAVELAAGVATLAPAGVLTPAGAVAPTSALVPTGEAEPDCHVLVVAGTVTHAIADDVRAAWEALPEPRVAVAFGACTISGGPYWDSYSVRPGLGDLLPPSAVVPGCPPGPDTLAAAVAQAVAETQAVAAGTARAAAEATSPAGPDSRSAGPDSRSEGSEDE